MTPAWPALVLLLNDPLTVRRLRLACGWVLFSYVSLHLVNHALGNVSWQAMERGAVLAEWVWRSPLGTAALYGALLTHMLLGFYALYRRRHWRMGWGEALRLLLGFSIVPLLIVHFVGQRYSFSFFDVSRTYRTALYVYFVARPDLGLRQVLLLCVAWAHGCMGMHFWLREKPWYRQFAPMLLALAVLLASLALLGVAQGGRQVADLARQNPAWLAALRAAGGLTDPALAEHLTRVQNDLFAAYFGGLALVLLARLLRPLAERRFGSVRIGYADGRSVRVPRGLTVLDASRIAGIPHASICGGRGRCSTCRIRVLRGVAALPEPTQSEQRLLDRLGAGASVRLACQLRPVEDVVVLPLLPPGITANDRRRGGTAGGRERFVVILFVDIRRSTALLENRPPFDALFILNHFFEAVGSAVAQAGGRPNQFIGDGMLAIFGIEADPPQACRQALAAARLIDQRVTEMNRTLAEELTEPIRIGIGLHAGNAFLGEVGYRDNMGLTAIGDTVNVAARLEAMTKELGCQMLVSDAVALTAGVDISGFPGQEISVRGRDASLMVRVIAQAGLLEIVA